MGDAAVVALQVVGVLVFVSALVIGALLGFAGLSVLVDMLDKRVRLRPWVAVLLRVIAVVVLTWVVIFVLELVSETTGRLL